VNGLRLALRQVRYENRAFWRNPAAAFFTFIFPLVFMVIFNVIFSGSGSSEPGFRPADFFTPAIIVFAVITATFTNLAMMVTNAREAGILKRVRGTPLPGWAYLLGRILHAVLVAFLLVIIVAAFGAIAYDVRFPWDRLAALVVTLSIATATFCAIGLALTAFIPNEDAAPAITNGVIFPILFISNVFIKMDQPPAWMNIISSLFPVRHFADAMAAIYDPRTTGAGFSGGDLAAIAAWGAVAGVVAIRFFRWEPHH
jgi:ABC-2 type transport system permease protein